MQLAAATLQNMTGGRTTVILATGAPMGQGAATAFDIASGLTSAAQTGTLLTIDVFRPNLHLSFDLHGQLPAVTATAAASPYAMTIQQGGTLVHQTYTLVIRPAGGGAAVASILGHVV